MRRNPNIFRTAGFLLAGLFAFQAPVPVFADGKVLDLGGGTPVQLSADTSHSAADSSRAKTRFIPADGAGSSEGPRALRELQAKEAARRDSLARAAHARDSLAPGQSRGPASSDSLRSLDPSHRNVGATQEAALPDTQPMALGEPRVAGGDQNLEDLRDDDDEVARGWFANLFIDLREGGGKGDGLDADEWAAIIYVAVGLVVVGAFLIYAVQTLVELSLNREHYPLFQEAGLRLSYSGHSWRDGAGADLYRDAYLAGLRYGIGFDRPGADIGLAVEGGYLDIHLSPAAGVGDAFDFRGGYMVVGPLVRFGSFDPLCFGLEFLNGTSTHASIGWISKARMTLQARFGRHEVVGAHLGAVFYDLAFLDGLGWRRGDFNRDLSLIGGLDFGWEF